MLKRLILVIIMGKDHSNLLLFLCEMVGICGSGTAAGGGGIKRDIRNNS
jgi:hypothetical protein